MSNVMNEEIKRWTARRKSSLVLDLIQGKTTVAEASRHITDRCTVSAFQRITPPRLGYAKPSYEMAPNPAAVKVNINQPDNPMAPKITSLTLYTS